MNRIPSNKVSICIAVIAMFTALIATAATVAIAASAADDYPAKPGRLILPSGAGSSSDIMARICCRRLKIDQ